MCSGGRVKHLPYLFDNDYKVYYEARKTQAEQYAKWIAEYQTKEEQAKDFAEKVYWRMHVKETEQCLNELIRGWK